MSVGLACRCTGTRSSAQRAWVVVKRRYHNSAFAGGHATTSDYSTIRCLSCGSYWRTKANYVVLLRSATHEECLRNVLAVRG